MTSRFIFRMTYVDNLELYFQDRTIRAKNVKPTQLGYQTSFADIVHRRGGDEFKTPNGGVVNDYVPFYFSPATSMAFTIHRGNVDLIGPDGTNHGRASMDDIAFIVCDPLKIASAGLNYLFTNIACNSGIPPVYSDDIANLENHIQWALFDDAPKIADIPEIGYTGVCRFFHNADKPEWQNRSQQRMAEFLVKENFPMELTNCIILKHDAKRTLVEQWINESNLEIPVLVKRGCYF